MHKQQKVGVTTSICLERKLTQRFNVASSSISTDYRNSLSTHLLSENGTFAEKCPGQQHYSTSQSVKLRKKLSCMRWS